MSKLPNAPLIEVIFELRWIVSAHEMQEIQYIHGDLYPLVKEEYPYRETIQSFPLDFQIIAPTHRFRRAENDYPLIQVGPGLLTVNTTDASYFWDDYQSKVLSAVENLQRIYSFKETHQPRFVLQYIDLIKFDFENSDALTFLKDKLNISIENGFYKTNAHTKNLILVLGYENELGVINFNLNRGKNLKGEEGIAIQTNITSKQGETKLVDLKKWLHEAHELCSSSFKEMTKGALYGSFK